MSSDLQSAFRPAAVVPCYNHPKTVGKVAAALRRLGLPVLLVNDGSNAETRAVLDALAQADSGIMVIHRPENGGKGAAVQSLRCQSDKNAYHARMKGVLERAKNLRIIQGEAQEILTEGGKVCGVMTTYGGILKCRAAILATGVYLNSRTITGDVIAKSGPNGFAPATALTKNLIDLQCRLVGVYAHFAAQRVYLPDQVALCRAAHRGVARHKGYAVEV